MSAKLCLITDDSPTVRKVARRILEKIGFEVEEAEDGRVALDRCLNRMPDVILLDWNMPVMNGIECLRSLRTRGDGRPKVIVCTTEGDVDHIHEAIEAGADEISHQTVRFSISFIQTDQH